MKPSDRQDFDDHSEEDSWVGALLSPGRGVEAKLESDGKMSPNKSGRAPQSSFGFTPFPPEKGGVDGRVRGLRLLIIDDDPARLDALAMALRALGAEVAVGDRFESGYSQASRLMPDAVISDIAVPGERGWLLVQRLRRHPILRWTPVLLLRWWKETPGGGYVLIDRVQDRLEEVLAPLRILRERNAAGRPLSERIEITGPPALLRFLVAERLRGMLILNDAWSIFEICVDQGKVRSVLRRGVDGSKEVGEEVLVQYLLCDAGRWSFRRLEKINTPKNIGGNLAAELKKACDIISRFFGPENTTREQLIRHIEVRLDVLESATTTLSTTAKRVAAVIRDGLDEKSLEAFLKDFRDIHKLERAMHVLFRCGAVRVRKKAADCNWETPEGRAIDSVARLLSAINDEHLAFEENSSIVRVESLAPESPIPAGNFSGIDSRGIDHLSGEKLEYSVTSTVKELLPPGEDTGSHPLEDQEYPEKTADLDSEQILLCARTQSEMPENATKTNKKFMTKLPLPFGRGFLKGMVFDSLASSPTRAGQNNRKQMWLAIGLALLLGVILIVGLVYIGSGSKSNTPAPVMKSKRR